MENSTKYIKPILQSLRKQINQRGGNLALSNPNTVAKIKENLYRLHPTMTHDEFKFVGNVMESLNSKN